MLQRRQNRLVYSLSLFAVITVCACGIIPWRQNGFVIHSLHLFGYTAALCGLPSVREILKARDTSPPS